MTKLNFEIHHQCLHNILPYHITQQLANAIWNENKEKYNSYDVIITSDTVALAYIFLLNLNELIPNLIILNSNRFTYAMEQEVKFLELLQQVQCNSKYVQKVTYIPYTDFERIWCAKHHLYLSERSILPIGKYERHINSKELMDNYFKSINTQYQDTDNIDTIFIQDYHNHIRFMNLSEYLNKHQISNVFGGYTDINELNKYKALVVLPDAFSKYFVFESIQQKLVVLVPSPRFLLNLVKQGGYFFNIEGSGGQLTEEFINLCEWYKYPETRIYFDSFDEMIELLKNLTSEKMKIIKKWCEFYGKIIEEEHLIQWKNIFNKIQFHKELSL